MKGLMVRYTLLRFLIFFACLFLVWGLGAIWAPMREDKILMLLIAAVLSVLVSYAFLKSMRDQIAYGVAERVEARHLKRTPEDPALSDELDAEEDAELDGR